MMRSCIGFGGFLAAVTIMILSTAPSNAADLRRLSSWDKSNWPTYAVVDRFVKNTKKLGGDAVNIKISGPEVVPPFEQLQPVKSGVFHMLFTHGVYHVGSKGLAASMDAIRPDPVKVRESGIWEHLDRFYQEQHGLKIIALAPTSQYGYHIFLKAPLSPQGDFRGRKVRGTQTYHGVIRALGGEPVVMPASQIYSALEKGVVEGAAWPAAGMLAMKHYEVAKYRIRPTFGTVWSPVFINLNSWKNLSDAEKDLLLRAGYLTELEMPWVGNAIQAEEDAELAKLGVEETVLPEEKASEVRRTFAESIWKLGSDCCGNAAREMRSLAVKAGLSY